eukprot:gene30486-40509_t
MSGNITDAMAAGISNASCVLMCMTKRYAEKVASKNQSDNCKLEFNYSIQKKIDFIIPIVMEKCMQRNADWPDGSLAMYFGTSLYYNLMDGKRAAQLKIVRQPFAFKDESYKWICVTPPSSTANEEEAAVTTPSNHITWPSLARHENGNPSS